MKKLQAFLTILIIICISSNAIFGQAKKEVTIKFKNNSMLPRHYTFVTYSPDSEGNGTEGVMMSPSGIKVFKVLVGTKFYLANGDQKKVVMSGKKLSDKPFYIAKTEDDEKTIKLRND
jgi:hypothetical protein